MVVRMGVRRARRGLLAALALGVLAVDYDGTPDRYFAYFTILTNLAIGVWFALGALVPERADRWSRVRLAVTLYGLLTFGVYWALLAPTDQPVGLQYFTNWGVHGLLPLAMAWEDLLVPWPRVGPLDPLVVCLWPVVYGTATLVRGKVTGWYPYFFFDDGQIGGGTVALYLGILALVLVVSAYLWTAVVHRRQGTESALPPR